jgi:allophanate hydrolase subunit 2
VISGGTATTVQDWPGRQGLWAIGVPPSGPMDDQSFRLGNRLLGNPEGTAGLEMTITGPILLFNAPARICLMGADFKARSMASRSSAAWRSTSRPGRRWRSAASPAAGCAAIS